MKTKEDLENMGEQEVRNSLARGDYIDPSEISLIESWLRERDAEHAFAAACERAAKSAALDNKDFIARTSERAKRAEIIAIIAVITAIISSACAITALFINTCRCQ